MKWFLFIALAALARAEEVLPRWSQSWSTSWGSQSQPSQQVWGSQPSQPTLGSQPSQPTWGSQPSQPTWGSQPSQPTWGSQPSQPTWGSQPSQPSGGSPVSSPSQPVDSSEMGVAPGGRSTSCKCGWANKDGGSRIVGGRFTKKHEYPFIVGLARPGQSGSYSPFCGGSIITPNHVITAAHCTNDIIKNREKIIVVLASHDRSQYSPDMVQIPVQQINQHENYVHQIFKNDVSVLTLASSINFNSIIGPVCLPPAGLDITGQTLRIIGWGAEVFQGNMLTRPKKVDVKAVPITTCAPQYGGMQMQTSPATQICTQAKGENACQGDSGGPVVWLDPDTNRYTLMGLVSFGDSCRSVKPDVHTRVVAFLPWIHKQIEATKPSNTCYKV